MKDQIIDTTMARALQIDAAERFPLFAWIVMHDQPEHPGWLIARLSTDHPSVYILRAGTLADLRDMLPPGLERSERQPTDPPEVVEVWFSVP